MRNNHPMATVADSCAPAAEGTNSAVPQTNSKQVRAAARPGVQGRRLAPAKQNDSRVAP
jgi:hypothetical protein